MPRSRRPPGEGRLIQLVYYAYVAGSAIARKLPEGLAYSAAQRIGALAAQQSRERDQVARNLARITGKPADSPEVQELVVAAYRSYARYWLETFALVREGREFFRDRCRSDDLHRIEEVRARGKGAIVAVAHLGNWDAAGAWIGANDLLLVTVAEVLKPRRMYDFFVDHRSALGMRIYPAAPGVSRKLIEEVEAGAVLAILADRDLKGTGPEVVFFGEKTTFAPGPASIALETGIPPMVAGVFNEEYEDGKRGWRAVITEPIELPEGAGKEAIPALTQKIADEIEKLVARRPEDWHVFQPFWKSDREQADRQRKNAEGD